MKVRGSKPRNTQPRVSAQTSKLRTQSSKPAASAARNTGRPNVHADTFEHGKKNVIRSNAAVVRGTPGDDIIIGGSRSQTIIGGGGNDIIIGGGGGDRINGGNGNDQIRGGAGGDTVHGGNGHDHVAGGRGNDTLFGDKGRDHLQGEIGDDHLSGGRGNDHASGGMGIDVLHGGKGNDVQSGDAGPDFIDGGKGNDTVSFTSHTGPGFDPNNPNSGVRVEQNQASNWRSDYEGVHYNGSAYGGSRAAGGSGVDGLKSNENAVGSSRDDQFNGDFDTVEGGPGRDTVNGHVRNNVSAHGEPDRQVNTRGAIVDVSRSKLTGATTINVTGGRKNDDITVTRRGNVITVTDTKGIAARGGGAVKGNTVTFRVKGPIDSLNVDGGDGNDKLKVRGFRADVPITLSGGNGDDRLVGGKGNDTLNDGAGNDVLIGGGGDDGLTNSQGRDRLRGGAGNDLLVSSSIDRGDFLDGGNGLDNVSFAQAGHDFAVRAQIGGTAQRIDKNGKGHGPKAHITGAAEDLEGTEENDILIGDGRDNHLLGRGGSDTLKGLGGNDLLEALYRDEDRLLDGGRGNDRATIDAQDRGALRNVENSGKTAKRR